MHVLGAQKKKRKHPLPTKFYLVSSWKHLFPNRNNKPKRLVKLFLTTCTCVSLLLVCVWHPKFACTCMRLVRVLFFFKCVSSYSSLRFLCFFLARVYYLMFRSAACLSFTCVYFWVLCFSSACLLPHVCFCLFASNS